MKSLASRAGALGPSAVRCRAKREHHERCQALLPESQVQKLAVTVLHVPYSLGSGHAVQGYLADEKQPPP